MIVLYDWYLFVITYSEIDNIDKFLSIGFNNLLMKNNDSTRMIKYSK